jgi:hypothetical protein
VRDAEEAIALKDRARIADLDAQLTDVLFGLD